MKLKFEYDENPEEFAVIGTNKSERLGLIWWYSAWECWVWEQNNEIIMSEDCLKQIYEFVKELEKLYPPKFIKITNKFQPKIK